MPATLIPWSLLCVLICPAAVSAQVPPEPAATAPQPRDAEPQTPPETAAERAAALLQKAARRQRGEQPRPAPNSLHGRFYVGVRDGEGALVKAEVERWYTRSPERMLTRRREVLTGNVSIEGWDGDTAWFVPAEGQPPVVYSAAPEIHQVDLELMAEQRQLSRLLLDVTVLDTLLPKLVELDLAGRSRHVDLDGGVHDVTIVSARAVDELYGAAPGAPPPAPDDPPPQLQLELALGADGALWWLRVTAPHRPDIAPLELRFDFFGKARDGLLVPGNVKVFRGGEALESANLGIAVDEDGLLALDIDVPVDAALFELPRG